MDRFRRVGVIPILLRDRTMTHEYDDPIDPALLATAADEAAARFRRDGGTLGDHAAAIVAARLCGCVADRGRSDNAAILTALVAEVESRARALLADAPSHGDPVEQSSRDSFPASDPPAWIGRAPRAARAGSR
jgi:hypothetical protein